jgi:drug/metabolite transporter (DMT)-like permease
MPPYGHRPANVGSEDRVRDPCRRGAGGSVRRAAYGLVLWAASKAPLAPVAALRETSSLMGAIIGAVVFEESFGRRRVLAAVVVTAGAVLTNL